MEIPNLLNQFRNELARRNYSQNSIKNYTSYAALFLKHFEDRKDLQHINANDIKDYLGKIVEVNTQRSAHSSIKKLYEIQGKQSEKFKYIPYARKEKKLEYLWNWVGADGDLFAFVFAVVYYFAVIRVGRFANAKISFL